ncbi:protocadherin gamma-B1-like [Rhinatrema bivittatum]|uniref:protocadherin gamma-B1-like n=1 Tax=Rhinatrema bivittatum TaxID=194408 RepID=UPI0011260942|nr:protocadherin gamma-B1-like [Rhinatrema bivittatum]
MQNNLGELAVAAMEITLRQLGARVNWQVIILLLSCWFCHVIPEHIRYSFPEEMEKGSIVGNIAKDMGLNVKELSARNLRLVSSAKKQYITVGVDDGNLYINSRIDREEICANAPTCILNFETLAENPLNIFPIKIEIQDINDNPPVFMRNITFLEISESSLPGARILTGSAVDPDVGMNSLQKYHLNPNQYFMLSTKENAEGNKYAELVLEKLLDREKQNTHHLILTATDGGTAIRTGTTYIHINVIDANDNSPIFSQEIFKINLKENTPVDTLVIQLKASDVDEGANGEIVYSFTNIAESVHDKFSLDTKTGEIRVKEHLDYEETQFFEMNAEAKDGGGLFANCKVVVELSDENDNAPEIAFMSVSSPVPEDAPLGTVIALINVNDRDSGANGKVSCHFQDSLPFQLISATNNYYKLLTEENLDREKISRYNITVIATDKGSPPLSTKKTIQLAISDINDNAPAFEQTSYTAYVLENNPPGASIYSIKASDLDLNMNSRITYSLLSNSTEEVSLVSYLTINSQSGIIYAQRSFNYEQLREFELQLKAEDGGSPPLSSKVNLRVFILDQNDNAPEILYPSLGSDGSTLFEMVTPSSEVGTLVTKVIAVDADSGHNAWLSYQLIQTTEPLLFQIGFHTGEIRTSRVFQEKDSVKQKMVILVKDNGQPPLSSTATLHVVFAETFQEALPELSNQSSDTENQSNLHVYLVIALVLVSFLFLFTIILVIGKQKLKSKKSTVIQCSDQYSKAVPRLPSDYCDRTLPYSYQLCAAPEYKEFSFLETNCQKSDILSSDNAVLMLLSSQDTSLMSETNTFPEINREHICGSVTPCLLNLELLVEEIMTIYKDEVEIKDINDNPPFLIEEKVS